MPGVKSDGAIHVCFMKQDIFMRILTHCTLLSCIQMASCNKIAHMHTLDDSFYGVLCGRLMFEFKLYAPSKISKQLLWRDIFMNVFEYRHVFSATSKLCTQSDSSYTSSRSISPRMLRKSEKKSFQVEETLMLSFAAKFSNTKNI